MSSVPFKASACCCLSIFKLPKDNMSILGMSMTRWKNTTHRCHLLGAAAISVGGSGG